MTKREVLTAYRCAVLELSVLEKQMARQSGVLPRGYAQTRLDGMPQGTNNPEAAKAQRLDGMMALLEEKHAELEDLTRRFEEILSQAESPKLRLILRMYYALGETDETIAETMNMSSRRINQLRNEFITQAADRPHAAPGVPAARRRVPERPFRGQQTP